MNAETTNEPISKSTALWQFGLRMIAVLSMVLMAVAAVDDRWQEATFWLLLGWFQYQHSH